MMINRYIFITLFYVITSFVLNTIYIIMYKIKINKLIVKLSSITRKFTSIQKYPHINSLYIGNIILDTAYVYYPPCTINFIPISNITESDLLLEYKDMNRDCKKMVDIISISKFYMLSYNIPYNYILNYMCYICNNDYRNFDLQLKNAYYLVTIDQPVYSNLTHFITTTHNDMIWYIMMFTILYTLIYLKESINASISNINYKNIFYNIHSEKIYHNISLEYKYKNDTYYIPDCGYNFKIGCYKNVIFSDDISVEDIISTFIYNFKRFGYKNNITIISNIFHGNKKTLFDIFGDKFQHKTDIILHKYFIRNDIDFISIRNSVIDDIRKKK